MLIRKIHVFLLLLLILPILVLQGCATGNADSPKGENAFVKGMRATVKEVVDTAKITACEVVSDDCPDLQRDAYQDI